MNADSFFCIGKTHAICQDYAEVGSDHVIISDGCSTAKESNIGAILLCRAAKHTLQRYQHHDIDTFLHTVSVTANHYALSLELPQESLYATLGIVRGKQRGFEAILYGDGVIAGRRRGERIWDVSNFEYPSGAPYYLAYKLDEESRGKYFNLFGVESVLTGYEVGTACDFGTCYSVKKGDNVRRGEAFLAPLIRDYPYKDYDMVAVMSDGACSFQKTVSTGTSKRQEPVHVCEVLERLLGFKNYHGQFVQRRCKAAFRDFSEQNYFNTDDFSIGVLHHCQDIVDET
jgi:hypothetical protein